MDMLLIFKIYLLYGLAFFAIFFAILFRNLKKSRIAIASALPTLALFGLIHGFHEWSELYLVLYEYDFPLTRDLHIFIVFKLWVSYIALGAFAWKMLDLTRWRHTRVLKGGTLAVVTLFVFSLFYRYGQNEFAAYLNNTANQIRWVFGLGAGALSGFAMMSYANVLEKEGHGASLPFKLTGLALILYGFSAGVLTVDYGLWVLILRTACALAILVTLWSALRVFDDEKNKQIEAAIQQTQQDAKLKELGELTSAVAHEIKTPLSSAMMSCDLLENSLPEGDTYKRHITRIRQGLERSAEISHEVLNYAHHKPIERESVCVANVIQSALSLNQYRLEGFQVGLNLDETLSVTGDAGQLEEVMTNIISNAIDASQSHKQLYIETYQDKLVAILSVSDWGTGMPQEKLEQAKTPFFTTKPRGEGTGMGLAISNQIILQHGGELLLRNSKKSDQITGLTVEIRLPRNIE
ncbi:sensor histidine kinase [Vibrio coralliilyticus]|uniref:sensor histidine kinase n=1 Tax=Vibrio coralliilyticus TaxID=190893 RepID=UPI00148DE609|nr:HAMP domain-containing sensor histidine kinase [Vibrio coralliilyticus]NOI27746.1 HAMP domain-containing histidine kinase [Vibrio coralliilyticus]NOI47134.1 HAMP domain-containing histidine kinase [Vibrio coralliilyticus]